MISKSNVKLGSVHATIRTVFSLKQCSIKQLFDSVFVISGLVKVSVNKMLLALVFDSVDKTYLEITTSVKKVSKKQKQIATSQGLWIHSCSLERQYQERSLDPIRRVICISISKEMRCLLKNTTSRTDLKIFLAGGSWARCRSNTYRPWKQMVVNMCEINRKKSFSVASL